jgi:hypothetical protein
MYELGPEGMLLAYSDDVYLHGPLVRVATTITAAPPLYKKVGLRIGWGPAKSELFLQPDVDPDALCLPRGEDGAILPHLVQRLEACLGIPRHRHMCVNFISKVMRKPAARHDRLLRLARDIAEDAPLTALRLLQVCGVNGFSHVISTVPPAIIRPLAEARDALRSFALRPFRSTKFRTCPHTPSRREQGELHHTFWCIMGEEATSVRIIALLAHSLPGC